MVNYLTDLKTSLLLLCQRRLFVSVALLVQLHFFSVVFFPPCQTLYFPPHGWLNFTQYFFAPFDEENLLNPPSKTVITSIELFFYRMLTEYVYRECFIKHLMWRHHHLKLLVYTSINFSEEQNTNWLTVATFPFCKERVMLFKKARRKQDRK